MIMCHQFILVSIACSIDVGVATMRVVICHQEIFQGITDSLPFYFPDHYGSLFIGCFFICKSNNYYLIVLLADFIIRALLTTWFCRVISTLSDLSKYRIYPNITWTKEMMVQGVEKYVYITYAIRFWDISSIPITGGLIQFYFPFIANFALPIAILNGVIGRNSCFVPILGI